jgi:peptide/nickel transport system substrate-binding protein
VNRWAFYTVLQHVLPRAMEFDAEGNLVASPLLAGAPTLTNGELDRGPRFRVTYRINPSAVWDDASPITSADFDFTWRAILGTKGSARKAEYSRVVAIDDSDPATVIVTFDEPWADWGLLFGGSNGFLLKRSAFSSVADDPRPNLSRTMLTTLPFSGGPYLLDEWTDRRAVLTRNERYFGTPARIRQVQFVPRVDHATAFNSLVTGEVAALFVTQPQPHAGLEFLDSPSIRAEGGPGTSVEVMWFNLGRRPTNDPAIREALMYAIDREAISTLASDAGYGSELNCGLLAIPNLGPWCEDQVFAPFAYDPERARAILETDGYDCSTSPCTKKGRPLRVTYQGKYQTRTCVVLILPA